LPEDLYPVDSSGREVQKPGNMWGAMSFVPGNIRTVGSLPSSQSLTGNNRDSIGYLMGQKGSAWNLTVVRAADFDDKIATESRGIDNLLKRDFKDITLDENAFSDDQDTVSGHEETDEPGQPVDEANGDSAIPRPSGKYQRCKEAIDDGLALFQEGKYNDAVLAFEAALELPGTGIMRLSGTVKEYACPSEGEENAALYNMACCYAKMNKKEPAITCIDALLENGFEDYSSIRSDQDLAAVQGKELENVLSKYDNVVRKVFKQPKKTEKPWLLW